MTSLNILVVVGSIEDENNIAYFSSSIKAGIQNWAKQFDCLADVDSLLLGLNINTACHLEEEYLARCTTLNHSLDNFSITLLSSPTCLILNQKIATLLTTTSDHSLMVFGGHFVDQSSGWCLQDGTYSVQSFNDLLTEERIHFLLEESEKPLNLTISCRNPEFWQKNLKSAIKMEIVDSIMERQEDENLYSPISPNQGFQNLTLILDDLLSEQTKGIFSQLEPPLQEGQLRSNNPCLYVMPGGTGDSAFFVCSDFNILLNGGSLTRPWFWKLLRHQYTVDCIIATQLSADCLTGINSLLLRKVQENQLRLPMDNTTGEHKMIARCKISPDVKMLFMNVPRNFSDKVHARGSQSDVNDSDMDGKLAVKTTHIVKDTLRLAQLLNLEIEPLTQYINPITVFYKISVGKLDVYILSPSEGSTELKYIQEKWGLGENKFQETGVTMENGEKGKSLLSDLASICCLLVFHPRAKDAKIIRILFPGNAPQTKILEGLDKLRHLDFLQISNPTRSSVEEFKNKNSSYQQNGLKPPSPSPTKPSKVNSASKPTNIVPSQSKKISLNKNKISSKPISAGSVSTTSAKNKTNVGPSKAMTKPALPKGKESSKPILPKGKESSKPALPKGKESPSKSKIGASKTKVPKCELPKEPPRLKAGPSKTKVEPPKSRETVAKKVGTSTKKVKKITSSEIAPAKREASKMEKVQPAASAPRSKVGPIRASTENRHKAVQNLKKKQKSLPVPGKKLPAKFTSKTLAPSTSKQTCNAEKAKKEDKRVGHAPNKTKSTEKAVKIVDYIDLTVPDVESEFGDAPSVQNEPDSSNQPVANLQLEYTDQADTAQDSSREPEFHDEQLITSPVSSVAMNPTEPVANLEPEFLHEAVINTEPDSSVEPVANIQPELYDEPDDSTDKPVAKLESEYLGQPIANLDSEFSIEPITEPVPSDELVVKEPVFSDVPDSSDEPVAKLESEYLGQPIANLDSEFSIEPITEPVPSDELVVKEPVFSDVPDSSDEPIANLDSEYLGQPIANLDSEFSGEPITNTEPVPSDELVVKEPVFSDVPDSSDQPIANLDSEYLGQPIANLDSEFSVEPITNTEPFPSDELVVKEPVFSDVPDSSDKPVAKLESECLGEPIANLDSRFSGEPITNTEPVPSAELVVKEPVFSDVPDSSDEPVGKLESECLGQPIANLDSEFSVEPNTNTEPVPSDELVVKEPVFSDVPDSSDEPIANLDSEFSGEPITNTEPVPSDELVVKEPVFSDVPDSSDEPVAKLESEFSGEPIAEPVPSDELVVKEPVFSDVPDSSDEPVAKLESECLGEPIVILDSQFSGEPITNTEPVPSDELVEPITNTEPVPSDELVVKEPVFSDVPDSSDEPVAKLESECLGQPIAILDSQFSVEPNTNTESKYSGQSTASYIPVSKPESEYTSQLVANLEPDPSNKPVANLEPKFYDELVNTDPDSCNEPVDELESKYTRQPVAILEPVINKERFGNFESECPGQSVANLEPEYYDEPSINTEPDQSDKQVVNLELGHSDELIVEFESDYPAQPIANLESKFSDQPFINTEPDTSDGPVAYLDSEYNGPLVTSFEPEHSDGQLINTKPIATFEPEYTDKLVAKFDQDLSDKPITNPGTGLTDQPVTNFESGCSDEPVLFDDAVADLELSEYTSQSAVKLEPDFCDEPAPSDELECSDPPVAKLEPDQFDDPVSNVEPGYVGVQLTNTDPEHFVKQVTNVESYLADGPVSSKEPDQISEPSGDVEPVLESFYSDDLISSVNNIVNNNVDLLPAGSTSNDSGPIFESMYGNKPNIPLGGQYDLSSLDNNLNNDGHMPLQFSGDATVDSEIQNLSNAEHQNLGDFLRVKSVDENRNFAELNEFGSKKFNNSLAVTQTSNHLENSDALSGSISPELLHFENVHTGDLGKGDCNESSLIIGKGETPAHAFDAMGTEGIKPSSSKTKKSAPQGSSFYFDLAYIPHHCNQNSVGVEFFKKIRSKYYVVSGLDASNEEPNEKVLEYLLRGKQAWESSKDGAESPPVTVIPTHNSPALHAWYQKNHRELESENIHLVAAGSKVMMQNEIVEACKIEF